MLGGPDRRNLFICTAEWRVADNHVVNLDRLANGPRTGEILTLQVPVPGPAAHDPVADEAKLAGMLRPGPAGSNLAPGVHRRTYFTRGRGPATAARPSDPAGPAGFRARRSPRRATHLPKSERLEACLHRGDGLERCRRGILAIGGLPGSRAALPEFVGGWRFPAVQHQDRVRRLAGWVSRAASAADHPLPLRRSGLGNGSPRSRQIQGPRARLGPDVTPEPNLAEKHNVAH